jgi:hypothetical protein
MIDDEGKGAGPAVEGTDSELLLYDYFKHLTSLTLLTLGGVLAIAQAADRTDVKPVMLIIVLIVISSAGILSFVGAGEIVRKRYTGSTTHNIDFYRKVAPALLAVGVGMFLGIYVDTLD